MGTASSRHFSQTRPPRAAENPSARSPPPHARAVVEHRHVAGLVQELEQRAQHQRRLQSGPLQAGVELLERVAQEREHALLGLVLGRQARDGLADHRRRGERLAVVAQPEEHVDEMGLRDRVQRAPPIEHEVADVERLQPAAPPGRGLAHALDHRVDAPQLAREQAQHPVGLAQGPRTEDDGAGLLAAHRQPPASRAERRAKTTRGMPARSARSCSRFERAGRREQRPHGDGLTRPDLDGQHAAGTQACCGGGHQPAIHVEPVLAAVERETRLVVAHVRLERAVLGLGDVRRVGDDEVEALLQGQIVEQIAAAEVDAAARGRGAQRCGAPPRPRPRSRRWPRRARTGSRPPGRARCSRSRSPHRAPEARRGRRRLAPARPPPPARHRERRRTATAASASSATSTSVSVSGRGISTAGVTSSSMVRKARRPRM